MRLDQQWKKISAEEIKRLQELYPKAISNELKPLDAARLELSSEILPARKAKGKGYLEKAELEKLVEWKLKHGKFRPNLMKLAQSNSAEDVRNTTEKAFAEARYSSVKGLQILTTLRGVGPATASLLLSVNDPHVIPFFSDELFRWAQIEEEDLESGKPDRMWSREIQYNKKEYDQLCERVQQNLERLRGADGITALGLENAAYALAKVVEAGDEVATKPHPSDEQTVAPAEEVIGKKAAPKRKSTDRGVGRAPKLRRGTRQQ